jgi:hypothetical protein
MPTFDESIFVSRLFDLTLNGRLTWRKGVFTNAFETTVKESEISITGMSGKGAPSSATVEIRDRDGNLMQKIQPTYGTDLAKTLFRLYESVRESALNIPSKMQSLMDALEKGDVDPDKS